MSPGRVLLDVDGVVAGMVERLCDLIQDLDPSDFYHYEFEQCLPYELYRAVRREMRKPGFAKTIMPHPAALTAVRQLQKLGAELVFMTKPYAKSRSWVHDREAWLAEHFPGIPTIHTAHKQYVVGDWLVEDAPHNIEPWLAAHPNGRAILVRQPWNKASRLYEGVNSRTTLATHLDEVPGIIEAWTVERWSLEPR